MMMSEASITIHHAVEKLTIARSTTDSTSTPYTTPLTTEVISSISTAKSERIASRASAMPRSDQSPSGVEVAPTKLFQTIQFPAERILIAEKIAPSESEQKIALSSLSTRAVSSATIAARSKTTEAKRIETNVPTSKL